LLSILSTAGPFLLAAASKSASKGAQSIAPTLIMFGLMFAIFYFLLIRPQRKREKERQDMLSQLKKNDRVVTQGGIKGIVMRVQDDDVVVKIDPEKNVKIRVSRQAITAVLGAPSSDKT